MTEGIELPNQEKIRTLEEKEKYLGILEAGTIKQVELKAKKKNQSIPQENEGTIRNQTTVQTFHQRENTLAVPLVRYSGPFLKWMKEELQQMNQRTRKLSMRHKALYPRHDVDRWGNEE